MNTTIKEIARKANVSLGTVDRVIHDRGKVAKKTKDKILKILEETGYKPNIYARGLVLNKSYTIAALIPDYNKGDYWELPSLGLNSAAQHLSQYNIKLEYFHFDQNNPDCFKEKSHVLLRSNPDGVIIAPVVNFEASYLCKKLNHLKIPFSFIDSKMEETEYMSFIGQDSFQSGKLAAKLINSLVYEKGKILIISIRNNSEFNKTLQKRIEGFNYFFEELDSAQKLEIEEFSIDQNISNWDKELKEILKSRNASGVYVPSSTVYHVARIIEDSQLKIKLVGNDLIKKNIQYIASGIIDYVIGQRPEQQGYLAFDNFYKYLITGQKVTRDNYLPLDIVTKENLYYYK
ncbi:substrate-binding domain-containing protein [Zunongwangia atlantica]|uniref:Transcriptional regulator, laci family protein n=1 Tax=Zunongwangia atlantica 22II14-10F7 TaxID=1185767 RepID=A0A1Y1T6Y2_9FLAO|nr:substrate-binding domain-containing protein [Zunongwangia atlantica]ORL46173.1 transcriptional regulator, laci family protein [Zunongwangia atlantica 22II14-10F7]|tara:strand:- start:5724 stop:6761 length:1038 start_codon:yes stop_codon:yes gene_type:complete